MDFFDGRCFKINKFLLLSLGLWPLQSAITNRNMVIVIICVAGTQLLAKIFGLVSVYSDPDLVFDCVVPIMIDVVAGIKFLNTIANNEKIKAMVKRIKNDYHILTNDSGLDILKRYSENGRKSTVIYAGAIFPTMTMYMFLPILPLLLETDRNDTDRPQVNVVNYYVDPQKYYLPILLHAYATISICSTAIVAVDTTFVIFVQHACGLFAVVGHHLEKISDGSDQIELRPLLEEDKPHQKICKCIDLHKKALEFAKLIEDSFSTSFIIQAGLNMLAISVTCIQVLANLDAPNELVRQVVLQMAVLVHLYFESSQGQQLLDHCEKLQENVINANWYSTSFRTRKLFNFIIMRVQVPSMLTAGKLFAVSMESFGAVVRTSVSYITVLQSMQ